MKTNLQPFVRKRFGTLEDSSDWRLTGSAGDHVDGKRWVSDGGSGRSAGWILSRLHGGPCVVLPGSTGAKRCGLCQVVTPTFAKMRTRVLGAAGLRPVTPQSSLPYIDGILTIKAVIFEVRLDSFGTRS